MKPIQKCYAFKNETHSNLKPIQNWKWYKLKYFKLKTIQIQRQFKDTQSILTIPNELPPIKNV